MRPLGRTKDFSIEGILSEETFQEEEPNNLNLVAKEAHAKPMKGVTLINEDNEDLSVRDQSKEKKFEWLEYSRFKPPRIPRRILDTNKKRKPSVHPRIPFSAEQIQFLEKRFRENNYLNKDGLREISEALDLSENRVKIWFQNRRARERKDLHRTL